MGRSFIYLFIFCIFSEFGLKYIQENGLEYPIVFVDKTGLGLRYCIKSKSIYIHLLRSCTGIGVIYSV